MPRTKKIYWSPDAIKMLMKLYKEKPHLYDSKHEHYFNKDFRIEAFRQIVLEMRKIYENVLSTDIKTKICTLRSQYLSYLKKEKKNGMAKPNWVLCVEFLRPFLKPPENQKSLDLDIKPEAGKESPSSCLGQDPHHFGIHKTEIKPENVCQVEEDDDKCESDSSLESNETLNTKKTKKIRWHPESIRMLILLYKSHPILYDPQHPGYRCKPDRAKSLQQIVTEMRKLYDTIDTADIKNKFSTLRSHYLSLLKIQSNWGTLDKTVPAWVEYIQFLKPFVKLPNNQIDEIKSEIDFDCSSFSHDYESDTNSACDPLLTSHIQPKEIRWGPDGIRMLIELYERCPNLYDPNHKQYRNKVLRANSFQQIVKEMRKMYERIDMADINSKIVSLRSQYLRYLKQKKSNKSTPFWVAYITFLKPYLKFTSDSDDLNMPAETDTEVPCYLSDLQSASMPTVDPLMDSLDNGRTSNKRKFKADVEAFGELIKAEMNQIENPSKRRELRMKLLKVIAEGVD
ncbi:uncharacterized protein LOC117579119 isoform X2 [Drosophila guanche]|uniref:uncharacterized protein LOC117579119 isoform X2 n=1 Tax=Drosophila guanche TaxID=7266 RepID=UPI001471B8B1|nr:uncharacterized protein LOC117579119 isoform X2 [Drosophila guanche]